MFIYLSYMLYSLSLIFFPRFSLYAHIPVARIITEKKKIPLSGDIARTAAPAYRIRRRAAYIIILRAYRNAISS